MKIVLKGYTNLFLIFDWSGLLGYYYYYYYYYHLLIYVIQYYHFLVYQIYSEYKPV